MGFLKINYFIIFLSKLFYFFKKEKQEPIEIAEIISPVRFQYVSTEKSTRTREESLELAKSFWKAERTKQETIIAGTKDEVIQEEVANSKDIDLIIILASNPWLNENLQMKMAVEEEYFDKRILCALARKINLSIEVQKVLAQSELVEVRRMLTRWQRPLNPSMLSILIKDDDLEVRRTIALNIGENIKVENVICFRSKGINFQKNLIDDPALEVRESLAANKFIKEEVQIKLIDKVIELKEWGNLTRLAEGEAITPKVSQYILDRLDKELPSFKKATTIRKLKENKYLKEKSAALLIKKNKG